MLERLYSYFEQLIATLLLLGTAVVIVLALGSFALDLFNVVKTLDPTIDYLTFQNLFEGILAVVIALELAHSVQEMATENRGVVQLRTVVLIGILAVVRKLIVLDIENTDGLFLLGLGFAVAALGAVYTATFITHRYRAEEKAQAAALKRALGKQ